MNWKIIWNRTLYNYNKDLIYICKFAFSILLNKKVLKYCIDSKVATASWKLKMKEYTDNLININFWLK
jgi:hypothetical protein